MAKKSVSKDGTKPRVCIVELGGTIGDIEGMSFVEAFRQFQFRVKRENFCCAHVSLVPQVSYFYTFARNLGLSELKFINPLPSLSQFLHINNFIIRIEYLFEVC